MGFSDIFSDFYNSIGFAELHAEAPPEEEKEDDEGGDDEGEEKRDDGDKEEGGEEGGEEEGGNEEEEEEEEEEEPEDPKPKLEEGKSLLSLDFHILATVYPWATASKGCSPGFFRRSGKLELHKPPAIAVSTRPVAESANATQQYRANTFPSPECAKSAQCAPAKHHYEECAERVTKQHEDPNHKGPKEDCVEECECDADT